MILLLSTSDTDLTSARSSGADYRLANPARTELDALPALLDGAHVVVVRILGGRRAWEDGLDTVLAAGLPVVVLGGEQAPDAELMELSRAPGGVVAQAHAYLSQGGAENLGQLFNFLSDTLLLTGYGFAEPVATPTWGVLERSSSASGPVVACSTTGRSTWPVIRPTSNPFAQQSKARVDARSRCSAPRSAPPNPSYWRPSSKPTR